MPLARTTSSAGPMSWAWLLVVLAARAYRGVLLTFTVLALAPLALSWGSYVVESGSMAPSIAVGDVVLARPTSPDDHVAVGRVYVFDDPAEEDRLLVHRIVERRDEGDFTSAGDANDVTDITPVPQSAIRARAVLRVPYVGLPVHWSHTGHWLQLAVWLLLTVAAFVVAMGRVGDRPTSRRGGRAKVAAATALVLVGAGSAGSAGAAFTDRTVSGSNTWRAGSWVQKYVGEVLADKPFGLWLLDEPAGSTYAADRSGNDRTGQYYGSLDLGGPGGLPANPGTAMGNHGGRVILGPQVVTAPNAYTIELWFRTTSRSRSYLAGFENDRDDSWWNATADRLVRMETSGRLSFGEWGVANQSITTPRAYNDGAWHHLVVTSTTGRLSTIYVDGVATVSGTTSAVDTYLGYWRTGKGSIGFFNGLTADFDGDLDNVAIYHSALPAGRVAAHWAAR